MCPQIREIINYNPNILHSIIGPIIQKLIRNGRAHRCNRGHSSFLAFVNTLRTIILVDKNVLIDPYAILSYSQYIIHFPVSWMDRFLKNAAYSLAIATIIIPESPPQQQRRSRTIAVDRLVSYIQYNLSRSHGSAVFPIGLSISVHCLLCVRGSRVVRSAHLKGEKLWDLQVSATK